MKYNFLCFFICWCSLFSYAQDYSLLSRNQLLGGHRIERDCFDVIHNDLYVSFLQIDEKKISGHNTISFRTIENSKRIQLDLFENLAIKEVLFNQKKCTFQRYYDSFFVDLPEEIQKGKEYKITVYYEGKPITAKQAPWDGGFVFSKDSKGNPFIGVACEGIGASSWWPCKDLLSDRCDSMNIHIETPILLSAISNGKLTESITNKQSNHFYWKVTYPIANYNISVTLGNFAYFQEKYKYRKTRYTLDFYVLKENLEKAKEQFKQVKPMLKVYEKLFGPYPFANDSYKLIDAPYLGMEHQSAIAYGNNYQNGYNGRYFAPISQKFDFIIIHESGHEYWGNHVGMADRSDMWINEALCTYTELLYVEKLFGKKYTSDYANYWTQVIQNKEAIVNERYSNIEPSGDIYYKGALLFHTLRYILNNDRLFLKALKSIQEKYAYQTIDTPTFIREFNELTKRNNNAIFNIFLHQASPAILNFTLTPNANQSGFVFRYKWDAVEQLEMPIEFQYGHKKYKVNVTEKWQEMNLPKKGIDQFEIDERKAYFIVKYE